MTSGSLVPVRAARRQMVLLYGLAGNIPHFSRIHAEVLSQGKSHAGIILAPQQRYSTSERIRRLLRLIAAKTAEGMHDQLVFLSDWT